MSEFRCSSHSLRDFRYSDAASDTISDVFRKARAWLAGRLLAEQREGKTGAETWCNILLGCWICDSLTGSLGNEFPQTLRAVATVLAHGGARPQPDWTKTPPTLTLIAASIFTRYEIHVDFLHSDAGYLRQAEAFLASLPRVKAKEDVAFYDKRLLMHRRGHMAKPQSANLTEVVRFAQDLPLADTGAGVDHLLGLISSATQLGHGSITLAERWLEDLLVGFAMSALRKYELTAGCRWMRAVHHLGMGGERLAACLEFLTLHQRPEGAFGYYDTAETPSVVKLPKRSLPFFIGTSLNLPVTVECLWTLAEISSSWRLFCSIW